MIGWWCIIFHMSDRFGESSETVVTPFTDTMRAWLSTEIKRIWFYLINIKMASWYKNSYPGFNGIKRVGDVVRTGSYVRVIFCSIVSHEGTHTTPRRIAWLSGTEAYFLLFWFPYYIFEICIIENSIIHPISKTIYTLNSVDLRRLFN